MSRACGGAPSLQRIGRGSGRRRERGVRRRDREWWRERCRDEAAVESREGEDGAESVAEGAGPRGEGGEERERKEDLTTS